ncbi:MAG: adenine-specific DNA methylase [Mycoplasmataceae bacterium RV_VA103A]|nr:MAG: adenine-specific DNA methylase [Mycoplasmataceae bacterium RV_VA103A]
MNKYLLNTKQSGEALELLTSLPDNTASLIFLDPQYEKVGTVLKLDYPLFYTSDYQILLLKTPNLKIVDCLVWYKKNTLGLGSWLRSQAEFGFLVQKFPYDSKKFANRSFGNVWEENVLSTDKRQHPHQKPRELIKTLIEATTQEGDLIVDPCAGSFVVLDACQELKREFIGCDLTFKEIKEFQQERERERIIVAESRIEEFIVLSSDDKQARQRV